MSKDIIKKLTLEINKHESLEDKELKIIKFQLLRKSMILKVVLRGKEKLTHEEEELIKTTGIEDFIAKTITDNFINNEDRFLNKLYLKVIVKTHTKIQTTVSDVQDNIYNLHTFMNNCTQKYNIVYGFSVEGENLVITIKQKNKEKE